MSPDHLITGLPIIPNDMLPTDTAYRTPTGLVMSRLTLGRMRTTLEAPDAVTPVIRLSFREWRRWKLRRSTAESGDEQ